MGPEGRSQLFCRLDVRAKMCQFISIQGDNLLDLFVARRADEAQA